MVTKRMKTNMKIFTVLMLALTTMPCFDAFALRGSTDCKGDVEQKAFLVWGGDKMESGFESFYSDFEKQVYKDTASLQKFQKKWTDAIKDESLLGDWEYTKPLSCDKEKGCFFRCNGYEATCQNGQKLKDCNKNVYNCKVGQKIEEEYKSYMVSKICSTSYTTATLSKSSSSVTTSSSSAKKKCEGDLVWVESMQACQTPETATANMEFDKKLKECEAGGATGYSQSKGCLCPNETTQKWDGTKCITVATAQENELTTVTNPAPVVAEEEHETQTKSKKDLCAEKNGKWDGVSICYCNGKAIKSLDENTTSCQEQKKPEKAVAQTTTDPKNNALKKKGMVCTDAKQHHLLATYNENQECIVQSCVAGYKVNGNACEKEEKAKSKEADEAYSKTIDSLIKEYKQLVDKIVADCKNKGGILRDDGCEPKPQKEQKNGDK